jgi:hypothetical protein
MLYTLICCRGASKYTSKQDSYLSPPIPSLERYFLVQGWERGPALRRAVFMRLLDSDYRFHHLIPNVRHVMMFVLLYRRTDNGMGERSYVRTFADYCSDIRSLASAKICLEFCGGYDADDLDWLNDWNFRTAESDIEDLLTKGMPLSARDLTLLESQLMWLPDSENSVGD